LLLTICGARMSDAAGFAFAGVVCADVVCAGFSCVVMEAPRAARALLLAAHAVRNDPAQQVPPASNPRQQGRRA
jgi:hypothetical protein